MSPAIPIVEEGGIQHFSEWLFRSNLGLLAYFSVHAGLGVMMRTVPGISSLHAFITIAMGISYCLLRRQPRNWAFLAGYVVAAEVVWKMTNGLIYWEQGKYGVILILALAIGTTRAGGNIMAMTQFALMLPSAAVTVMLLPLALAVDSLSFNMSGPLCLCVASVFFAGVRLSPMDLFRLFVVMLGPLFGIAVITVFNILTVPVEFEFKNSSNYFVTGGFGPNQVSAALGLGILLCFVLLLAGRLPTLSRIFLGGTLLLMISQSAFTFSRNGIYCGVGASILAIPFLVVDAKARKRLLFFIPVLAVILIFVLIPRIDEFTGGKLTDRFEQTSGSGREDILAAELELWKSNPVFGVGPGVGRYVRADVWEAAAHTEFTRLLAEHGLFGLLALLLYPVLFIHAFLSSRSPLQRGIVTCSVAWAISFMLVNAMRMAAPGFMFGLAFAQLTGPAAFTGSHDLPALEVDDTGYRSTGIYSKAEFSR